MSIAIFPRMVASLAIMFSVSGYGEPLRVATWGGSHAELVNRELLVPFAAQTGIQIKRNSENSVSPSAGHEPLTGVVELDFHDAQKACDEGRLLFLPYDDIEGPGGARKLIRDYLPNTLQPCSIAHAVWSTVAVFDAEKYALRGQPALIADFFNTDDFPGKRVVQKSPRILAEWAIAAHGVPLPDIYAVLGADESSSWAAIERKLEAIENDIVWVDNDSQAIEYLESGHATFAVLGSDSVVRHSIQNGKDLGVIWNAAVTEFSMWAIPSDAPRPDKSLKFLKYATSEVNSAKVSSQFGYGPARYTSLKLMDQDLQVLLPSWPENHTNMIMGNARWWREHGGDINQQFAQWVAEIEAMRLLALTLDIDDISNGNVSLRDPDTSLLPPSIPMQ